MAEDTSLEGFLARRPPRGGSSAWCCHVVAPEHMAEIERMYARGVRKWAGCAAWLKELGYKDATVIKIAYHFDRGHHERSG